MEASFSYIHYILTILQSIYLERKICIYKDYVFPIEVSGAEFWFLEVRVPRPEASEGARLAPCTLIHQPLTCFVSPLRADKMACRCS